MVNYLFRVRIPAFAMRPCVKVAPQIVGLPYSKCYFLFSMGNKTKASVTVILTDATDTRSEIRWKIQNVIHIVAVLVFTSQAESIIAQFAGQGCGKQGYAFSII